MHVLNRAVRATGVAHASFCHETLLHEPVDALVLEFAVNDGLYPAHGLQGLVRGGQGVGGQPHRWLDPLPSMERLLRRLRLTRPHALLIVLYMCPPAFNVSDAGLMQHEARRLPRGINVYGTCDGLYSRVARHYGVLELSVHRPPEAEPHIHADDSTHFQAACLVARALLDTRRRHLIGTAPHQPPAHVTLPSPIVRGDGWEADGVWACRACDSNGCDGLEPAQPTSFTMSSWSLHAAPTYVGKRKFGWLGARSPQRIVFNVSARARVLVSFLCSYENVGEALVRLGRHDGLASADDGWRVDLRWASRSSQQCLLDVGVSGDEPGDQLQVLVLNASDDARRGKNQVKIFGLYEQHQQQHTVHLT